MARRLNFLPDEGMAARLLPWVIGVMVLLSGLAAALAVTLHDSLSAWEAATNRSLTVQIVAADKTVLESEAEAAAAFLESRPGIAEVRPIPPQETAQLLAPWLGEDVAGQDLPLPRMIEVTLTPDSQVSSEALRTAMKDKAPHTRIDAHETWLTDLLALSTTIQAIALAVVVLIGIATVAIIIFATLSRLASHRENIEIVHLMGAQDSTIAREFQWRFLWVGIRGGVIGLASLTILLSLVVHFGQRLQPGLMPDMTLGWTGIGILLGLPVAAGLMTMITARMTVMRVLSRMM